MAYLGETGVNAGNLIPGLSPNNSMEKTNPQFGANAAPPKQPLTPEEYLDNYYNNFDLDSFFHHFKKEAEYRDWLRDKISREFNERQAKAQRQWEEYMSNTAISRRMKDYENSGLNPMMAVMNQALAAADTPSGTKANWNHKTKSFERDGDKKAKDILKTILGIFLLLK